MNRPLSGIASRCQHVLRLTVCALAVATGPASAQTTQRLETPTAEEILEHLAPPPASGARATTRSLGASRSLSSTRNLAVQERSVDLVLNFELDSAQVSGSSAQTLENLSVALRSPRLAGTRFVIEGHTCALGGRAHNQTLSVRRADAVVARLRAGGVEGARLDSVGRGFDDLLRADDPYSPENRRVRIRAVPTN
jgi:outer membrane protein OmpA-like peptidoglycan-associated protein